LMAWATILVYQSRMVPFDFNRRLKALVEADGAFLWQDPTLPLSRTIYRQQLAMQLGSEVITRTTEVKNRIEESPIVAQYTYDTLYMPSFYHERGRTDLGPNRIPQRFKVTREDLVRHLWFRAGAESIKSRPDELIAPETVDYLFELLKRYADLLAEPSRIQEATRRYARALENEEMRRLWLGLADALDLRELMRFSVEWVIPEPEPEQADMEGDAAHG